MARPRPTAGWPDLIDLGFVLTGGASTRMGTDKALVPVDGVPMARRVADALTAGGCTDVYCVGGDADALGALGLDVLPDDHPGEGPLGGLLTALDLAAERGAMHAVVSACDLPWLDGISVADLLTGVLLGDVAQPPSAPGRQAQLLFAANVERTRPVVADLFAAGERSLRWLGARFQVITVRTIPPEVLRDVDAPEDLG